MVVQFICFVISSLLKTKKSTRLNGKQMHLVDAHFKRRPFAGFLSVISYYCSILIIEMIAVMQRMRSRINQISSVFQVLQKHRILPVLAEQWALSRQILSSQGDSCGCKYWVAFHQLAFCGCWWITNSESLFMLFNDSRRSSSIYSNITTHLGQNGLCHSLCPRLRQIDLIHTIRQSKIHQA